MQVPAAFARPDAVTFALGSSLPRDEVLDRIEGAIGGYYAAGDGLPRVLRLDGSVIAGRLHLTVLAYARPGRRSAGPLPLLLDADVLPTVDGCEVRGTATAARAERAVIMLFAIVLAWVAIVGFLQGSLLGGLLIAIYAAGIGVFFVWLYRHNQRWALARMDAVLRVILEPILAPEHPVRPGPPS